DSAATTRESAEDRILTLRGSAILPLQMNLCEFCGACEVADFERSFRHVSCQRLSCRGKTSQSENALVGCGSAFGGIIDALSGDTEHAIQLRQLIGPFSIAGFLLG